MTARHHTESSGLKHHLRRCLVSKSATAPLRFASPAGLDLEASFDGGRLTSDGGMPWLDEAERAIGVCASFAQLIPDWRGPRVRHSLAVLVRQRVFQIACGYEDQNDADQLRSDPLLKLVCGRLPETDADLASQPTLSRLENAVDRHACEAMAEALVTLYIRELDVERVTAVVLRGEAREPYRQMFIALRWRI